MASGNRKRFSCGHKGFGQQCHRCEMASKLEEMATSNKPYVTHKKAEAPAKPKRWTVEEMLEEAKRLRTTGRR